MNLDDYVKTVGDYADQLATAADAADRDTLSVAIAIGELYESKEWVELGLELLPIPKNPKSNRAWQPDTIERFHKVTNALLEQAGRSHRIKSVSTTTTCIKAYRVARRIPKSDLVRFRSERQLRPLGILLNAGLGDRIPEAVALAVQDAADRGKPISGESMGRAARVVKHNAEQGRASLGQHKIDRLAGKRMNAQVAVQDFLDLAQKVKAKDPAAAQKELTAFKEFLKEELAARRK